MSEVGALVKEHIKSSVLDSGELEIIIREPKGNAWGLGSMDLGSEEWSGVEKGRAPF